MRGFLALGLLCCVTAIAAMASAQPPTPNEHEIRGGACGAAGQPDCPMQSWMKSNLGGAIANSDFARLEKAFARLAKLTPAGYAIWEAAAKGGARAAAARDLEGCRKACRQCHDEHRARYRAELRDKPL